MRKLLFLGLLTFSLNAYSQADPDGPQSSALKPSSDNYSDVNTFDRNPTAVDPGPSNGQSEDESQKIKQPTNSQNMPVDQD